MGRMILISHIGGVTYRPSELIITARDEFVLRRVRITNAAAVRNRGSISYGIRDFVDLPMRCRCYATRCARELSYW